MNRQELYLQSTRMVLKGYQKKTLLFNDWGGCGVAHLIAGNNKFEIRVERCSWSNNTAKWYDKNTSVDSHVWGKIFSGSLLFRIKLCYQIGATAYKFHHELISDTGYTRKELKKIMKSFDDCFVRGCTMQIAVQSFIQSIRDCHRVRFHQETIAIKKRLVRQNKLLLQTTENYPRYKWYEGIDGYPKTLHLPSWYQTGLYWCVWMKNKMRSLIDDMVPLNLYWSIFVGNKKCLQQHLLMTQTPALVYEEKSDHWCIDVYVDQLFNPRSTSAASIRYDAPVAYA